MKKLMIYLDTSVFSAYYDKRMKIRQSETKEFWGELEKYDKFISDLVLEELDSITNKKS